MANIKEATNLNNIGMFNGVPLVKFIISSSDKPVCDAFAILKPIIVKAGYKVESLRRIGNDPIVIKIWK